MIFRGSLKKIYRFNWAKCHIKLNHAIYIDNLMDLVVVLQILSLSVKKPTQRKSAKGNVSLTKGTETEIKIRVSFFVRPKPKT